MAQIVIFDLYDTLLKGIWFSFDKGVEYLYETYFTQVCTPEELRAYSKTFLEIYAKRKEENLEISFVKEELPLYFTQFQLEPPEDMDAVEDAFLEHMKEDVLLEEVRETLVKLKAQNIPMYVLSNSIFSGRAAKKYIAVHGILDYFEKVYSSADYGVKKPGKAFFDIAVNEILEQHPECRKEDIYFVGNDYELDAAGGCNAGLKTIWYNVEHLANERNLDVRQTDDFRKIPQMIGVK